MIGHSSYGFNYQSIHVYFSSGYIFSFLFLISTFLNISSLRPVFWDIKKCTIWNALIINTSKRRRELEKSGSKKVRPFRAAFYYSLFSGSLFPHTLLQCFVLNYWIVVAYWNSHVSHCLNPRHRAFASNPTYIIP